MALQNNFCTPDLLTHLNNYDALHFILEIIITITSYTTVVVMPPAIKTHGTGSEAFIQLHAH